MTTTTKLALELLQNNAANQTLANTTFAQLNQLVQAGAVDKDLATPPGSPANEALYIVASSPTGAWTGHAGDLAYWLTSTGAWQFIVPREGMLVHVNDEDVFYKYTGSAWVVFTAGGGATPALVSAYQSSAQSIPNGSVWTKVNLQTELVDTDNYFNTSTSRFQPTVAGYYLIIGALVYLHTAGDAGANMVLAVYKNGSRVNNLQVDALLPNTSSGISGSCIVQLNGTTDYVELFTAQGAAGALSLSANSQLTFFQALFLRS